MKNAIIQYLLICSLMVSSAVAVAGESRLLEQAARQDRPARQQAEWDQLLDHALIESLRNQRDSPQVQPLDDDVSIAWQGLGDEEHDQDSFELEEPGTPQWEVFIEPNLPDDSSRQGQSV